MGIKVKRFKIEVPQFPYTLTQINWKRITATDYS